MNFAVLFIFVDYIFLCYNCLGGDNVAVSGNKGKFSERLKRIAWFKRRKKNDENSGETFNFIRRVLLIPVSLVENKILNSNKKNVANKKNNINNNTVLEFDQEQQNNEKLNDKANIFNVQLTNSLNKDVDLRKLDKNKRILKVNNVKAIDTSLKDKIDLIKNDIFLKKEGLSEKIVVNSRTEPKEKLEKEIINLIKKRLVKCINEYEVLQSDLYVLKEIFNDDLYYQKCIENINEIKRLLSKINDLKSKYDYLKDNVDFEYLLSIDDDTLSDKIISLKDMLQTNRIDGVVKDYKLLEEYKYLYLKVDKLQEDALLYEEKKNEKVKEIESRDVDFEKLKEKLFDASFGDEKYKIFLRNQDNLLNSISKNVDKIDSREVVDYSFHGFGKLIKSSFKLLGLFMLSPFKGTFPHIATQTAITKGEIKKLSSSFGYDEKKYTEYFAYNYADEINKCINDIDYTSNLVNGTLEDIIRLKKDYVSKFKKYQDKFPEYQSAIKKINKIENSVISSKLKLDIIKAKMIEKEKINNKKMAKILSLNSNSKNNA